MQILRNQLAADFSEILAILIFLSINFAFVPGPLHLIRDMAFLGLSLTWNMRILWQIVWQLFLDLLTSSKK